MKPDIFQLDLSTHCIETELKRLYNQILNRLIQAADPEPGLEKQFKHLVTVLEKLDFQKLRGRYPELAGFRENINIELIVAGESDITLLINGEKIYL
jgi:hypothetical protein